MERGSARRFSLQERERAIVNQTNTGTVSKATLGKLMRVGVERIWALLGAEIPSLTELNCAQSAVDVVTRSDLSEQRLR